MNLIEYEGKKVRILAMNGRLFEGKVTDYVYPEDNDPEVESIIIDDILSGNAVEFPEDDIKSIEIIA